MTSKLISFTLILILISGFVYVTNKGEKLSIQGDSLVANSRMITATPSSENILGKKGGLRTVYTNTVPSTPSTPSNPDLKKGDTPITCVIAPEDINRIDRNKHPLVHEMIFNSNSGYCGPYAFLQSLYHTFNMTEITTNKGKKIPIADPEDPKKENLNLAAVENLLSENPGLMNGTNDDEIPALYRKYNKQCYTSNIPLNSIKQGCAILKDFKDKGYDCQLSIYRSTTTPKGVRKTTGHAVYVHSAKPGMLTRSCTVEVRNSFNQKDPKLQVDKNNPQHTNGGIHAVEISHQGTNGVVPSVKYKAKEDMDWAADSTEPRFLCCK